jgi:hypothetical protein
MNDVALKDRGPLWRRIVSAVRTAPLTVSWRVLVVGVLLGLVFLAGRLSVQKPTPIGSEVGGSAKVRQDDTDVYVARKSPGDVSVDTGLVARNATKSDLESTKGALARSEMGTLIARNHDELDELRRLGERDYDEFTLTLGAGAQRVRVVQLQLRETNPKTNEFTIKVLADDKTFEKKNRSVNEPIFFYTGGSRVPLELVVNEVTKTTVSGYLSIPKAVAGAPPNTERK